jgi:pyruvate/2-oxoacid:ferredoxin oxidoreductase alpha subunit
MKKLMTGNQAFAYGVMLSRVEVISAYPITPQTSVVEELAELQAREKLTANFVRVESEHSSMSCVAAASMTGVRTFTATSSQGLAFMHEMLHWASGSRLPVVMVNVNRAIGAPWNVWNEQTDSLAQRDTGWLQIYCASAQECLDSIIQAYRLAESIHLPVMLVSDGFYLSHTSEPVDIPHQEDVDAFLPPYEATYKLDPMNPHVFNCICLPQDYTRLRRSAQQAMKEAIDVLKDVSGRFSQSFGRNNGVLEGYRTDGAEMVMLSMGTICTTAKDVVDEIRDKGFPVGLIRLRLFRPFPSDDLMAALQGVRRVAVVDRGFCLGVGGILAQELKAALFGMPDPPQVHEYITGLGGMDVTPEMLAEIMTQTLDTREKPGGAVWTGAEA